MNKFVENDKLFIYVKRLGQRHYSLPSTGETLCGMPMLGYNYANTYSEAADQQEECNECARKSMELMFEENILEKKKT